jgi:hypothetical protein
MGAADPTKCRPPITPPWTCPHRSFLKIYDYDCTTERNRQIEAGAHSKLRNFACAEGLETFEI